MKKQIKFFSAVKETFVLLKSQFQTILKIIWLPILSIIIIDRVHAYYLIEQSPMYDYSRYLEIFLKTAVMSILTVGLYQLIINQNTSSIRYFNFKFRAISPNKTLLSIPFYARFDRPEFMLTLWGIFTSFFLGELPNWTVGKITGFYFHDYTHMQTLDTNTIHTIFFVRALSSGVNVLLVVIFSFIAPYLSLNRNPSWKGFKEAIQVVKNYMFSILYFQILIYAPYYFSKLAFAKILVAISSSPQTTSGAYYLSKIFRDVSLSGLRYIADILIIIFISLLYKALCPDLRD